MQSDTQACFAALNDNFNVDTVSWFLAVLTLETWNIFLSILSYLLWLPRNSHCTFSCGCLFFPYYLQKAHDFCGLNLITVPHSISRSQYYWFCGSDSVAFTVFTLKSVVVDAEKRILYWYSLYVFSSVAAGAFDDEDIIHVERTEDPVRDMEIIHDELRLKDEEMIGPIIDKLKKTAIRGGDKKLKPEHVSQCPSRPFATPHSETQIITLPHTWPRRKKYVFFNLPPIGLTPPPGPFFSPFLRL